MIFATVRVLQMIQLRVRKGKQPTVCVKDMVAARIRIQVSANTTALLSYLLGARKV